MANKKISELESRASLSLSDLMAVGDPSTGYLYKTTISDLKTLTGAGVVSFNGRFGTVNPAEGDYTLTQLGDVIITSAANNDVLKYNGSNWVNTQLYTGTVAQYIDGTGAYQTFPTLLSSDRLVTNVRNTSGATITKGTVVYLNGSSGTLPTIAKAQANAESTSTGTYGVVQDNIANNANGYVVVIGNLTALDTSAYNAGDILWLSPTVAGGYTTTKPVAPNHAVYVGIVTRSSNTQGTIEVKIQNGYELDELHNVLITSVANNDVLVYETASSLWKNKAFSTLSTDTLDSVTGRGNTTANSITVGSVSAAGLSNLLGQIRTFVTTGNTYIGANPTSATDAGFKLDVNGTTRLNGATSVTGVLTGSDTIRSTNGTVTVSISYGSTAGIIGTTSNHSLEIRTNNTYRVGVSTAGVVNVSNLIGTGSRIVVADASGNLSASSALTGYVTLDTAQTITGDKIFSTAISAVGGISLRDTVGGSNYGGIIANSSYFQISAQGGSGILIKASDGTNALTIGTTGNTAMTNVTATSFIKSGGTSSQFLKADGSVDSSTYLTSASVSGVYLPLSGGTLTGALNGTSATFSGDVTSTGTGFQGRYARIFEASAQRGGLYSYNVISGAGTDYSIGLFSESSLWFAAGGGVTKHLIINSNGNVGINNSNPAEKLDVYGNLRLFSAGYPYIDLGVNTSNYFRLIHDNPNDQFLLQKNGSTRLSITGGGAATFSSSVTAGGFLANGSTTIGMPIDTGGTKAYFDASGINGPALTLRADGVGRTIRLTSDGSGSQVGAIDINSAGLNIGTNSSHPIIFKPQAVEVVRITSSGLYIGNTAALGGEKFSAQIIDSRSISSVSAVARFMNNGVNYIPKLILTDNNTADATICLAGGVGSKRLSFGVQGGTSGHEYFNILESGSIGINTTNPNGALSIVAPSSSTAISIWGRSGDNFGALRFQSNTGATTYATIYSNASDLHFENNGSARLTIASNGTATFSGDVKVKTLEVTNVGTDATSSGVSTYMRITVNGQNYLIPLHGTP